MLRASFVYRGGGGDLALRPGERSNPQLRHAHSKMQCQWRIYFVLLVFLPATAQLCSVGAILFIRLAFNELISTVTISGRRDLPSVL